MKLRDGWGFRLSLFSPPSLALEGPEIKLHQTFIFRRRLPLLPLSAGPVN